MATTYREIIAHSLQNIEPNTFVVDGETFTSKPTFPLGFAYFTTHLASIYAMTADMYTLHEFPSISIGDEESDDDGSPIEMPSILEVCQILAGMGSSVMRRLAFFMQVQGFLTWLMDEEIPVSNSFDDPCWYDVKTLGDKWNEFAEMKRGEQK